MEYQTIRIDKRIYEEILRLAQINHRTIGGQVAWMVEHTVEEILYPEDVQTPIIYKSREE